jgi:hypothetical protein
MIPVWRTRGWRLPAAASAAMVGLIVGLVGCEDRVASVGGTYRLDLAGTRTLLAQDAETVSGPHREVLVLLKEKLADDAVCLTLEIDGVARFRQGKYWETGRWELVPDSSPPRLRLEIDGNVRGYVRHARIDGRDLTLDVGLEGEPVRYRLRRDEAQ